MDEILEIIHQDEDKNHGDVIIIPPDVDGLTDHEDFEDEGETGEAIIQDVPGTLELHTDHEIGENADMNEETAVSPLTTTNRRKKRKLCDSVPNWRYTEPQYTKVKERVASYSDHMKKMKEDLQFLTPVELFEQLLTPDIYDHIVKETVRYASTYKNNMDFILSVDELKAFVGILLFSSYHKVPSERSYWSNDEDLGVSIVKNAMARNRFQMIKNYVHFTDNATAQEHTQDRGFKIRPLITMLQESFRKFGVFEENLSVDEMIVRYYGHNTLKQFMRGKPIRFGYKFWALCGVSGYCYNFDLYCGKGSANEENSDLLLGSKVVLNMLSVIDNPFSYNVYFDNLFTDYALLVHLRNLGFNATGTMRENRISKCPLKESNAMQKEPRGTYDYRFDRNEEILIVKWVDNKCVTIGTNHDTVQPVKNVQRWRRESKSKGNVPQPNVLHHYNMNMGGVDKHDWFAGKYSITIKGKKWYWNLFIRLLDMTMINAWIVHRMVHGSDQLSMTLLEFKRQVCIAYIKGSKTRTALGKKKTSGPPTTPSDVRFDNKGHFLEKRGEQRRCQNKPCSSKPRTYCKKCTVTLCVECFVPYHSKE